MFDLFFFSVYNSETLTELMSPNEKKNTFNIFFLELLLGIRFY